METIISYEGWEKIWELVKRGNHGTAKRLSLGALIKQEGLSTFKIAKEWAYTRYSHNTAKCVEMIDLFKTWFGENDFSDAKSIEQLINIEVARLNKKRYIK